MNRGGKILAVLLAVLVGAVTWLFLARVQSRVPPLVFSVETDLRQYDIGLATRSGSRLLTNDKLSHSPAWSPDGSQIAFLRGEPDSWEECCGYVDERFWVMDADGSHAMPVSEVLGSPGVPHWARDGRSLIFTENRTRGAALYQLDLASSEASVVLDNFSFRYDTYAEFSLSPDGTQLVTGDLEPRQIVIVNLADGVREVIANDVFGYGTDVRWSPDGEWLVLSGLVRGVDDGGDELLICRQIPDPALNGEFYDERGELWLIDVGDGGSGQQVQGYDELLYPNDPPGNCVGGFMDARVVIK